MSNKIRAYVSHSIRGKFGAAATETQRELSSAKGVAFGNSLRKKYPEIDWYIPGEHCEMDYILITDGYIKEEQILEIDCKIISKCNFMVVYSPDDFIGEGMKIEVDHCVLHSIPVIAAVDGDDKEYFKRICYGVNCHLVSMLR